MRSRLNRMTIYDMMDAKGEFEKNPANSDARSETGESLYLGPVKFPQMFYHPEGQERVLVPGELLTDSRGNPVMDYKSGEQRIVGEQREIIWQIVNSQEEADHLVSLGWHDHPAKAMTAAGKEAPAISSDQRIGSLEAQIADLQKQLDMASAGKKSGRTSPASASELPA